MFRTIFNILFGKREPMIPEVVAPPKQEEKKKLPSDSKLQSMKKGELETLGLEFGIDLDKRKTKKNMIIDLKSAVSG